MNENKRRINVHLSSSQIIFLLLTIWAVALPNRATSETLMPDEFRIVSSIAAFEEITQVAAVYRVISPRVLHADYLEIAAGAFAHVEDTRPMISVGPAWEIPAFNDTTVLRLGIAPTVLSDSSFGEKDLGGNFHFTSFVGIASKFGRDAAGTISFRLQHTSNAGLKSRNPGLDMAGISINFRFGR